MKHLIYGHIKALNKEAISIYTEAPSIEGALTHKWFPLHDKITGGTGRFNDVIRKLSILYEVLIVRNPHNSYEGIYVIGKPALVEAYIVMLSNIIDKVEICTSRYKKNRNNAKLHFSEAKSLFRAKCVNLYIIALSRLIDSHCDRTPDSKERYQLRYEYYKTSQLKTKKVFNAKPPSGPNRSSK